MIIGIFDIQKTGNDLRNPREVVNKGTVSRVSRASRPQLKHSEKEERKTGLKVNIDESISLGGKKF